MTTAVAATNQKLPRVSSHERRSARRGQACSNEEAGGTTAKRQARYTPGTMSSTSPMATRSSATIEAVMSIASTCQVSESARRTDTSACRRDWSATFSQ